PRSIPCFVLVFTLHHTATTAIYALSLHDALPIFGPEPVGGHRTAAKLVVPPVLARVGVERDLLEEEVLWSHVLVVEVVDGHHTVVLAVARGRDELPLPADDAAVVLPPTGLQVRTARHAEVAPRLPAPARLLLRHGPDRLAQLGVPAVAVEVVHAVLSPRDRSGPVVGRGVDPVDSRRCGRLCRRRPPRRGSGRHSGSSPGARSSMPPVMTASPSSI